jgi:hypothetical protein
VAAGRNSIVYILIDLDFDAVQLAEPEDTHRFHVAIANGHDDTQVDAELAERNAGRLDPDDDDHMWISAARVRDLAAGRVGANWSEHFDKMLRKGAKHGWYNEATDEIKAHVEWLADEDELTELGD